MTSKEPPNSHRIRASLTIDQALGKELDLRDLGKETRGDLMCNSWDARVPKSSN